MASKTASLTQMLFPRILSIHRASLLFPKFHFLSSVQELIYIETILLPSSLVHPLVHFHCLQHEVTWANQPELINLFLTLLWWPLLPSSSFPHTCLWAKLWSQPWMSCPLESHQVLLIPLPPRWLAHPHLPTDFQSSSCILSSLWKETDSLRWPQILEAYYKDTQDNKAPGDRPHSDHKR